MQQKIHKLFIFSITMTQTRTQKNNKSQPSSETAKPKPPKRYAVLILNDDYTPMDFVVSVLVEVFQLPHTQAMALMLLVHHEGQAVCGLYQKDIAQTKCLQVQKRAQEAGFPLKCVVKEA